MNEQSRTPTDEPSSWLGSLPTWLQVIALLSVPIGWWLFFRQTAYTSEVLGRAPEYANQGTGQIYAMELRGPSGPVFLTLQEYILIAGPPYFGGVFALAFFVFLIAAYLLRNKTVA